MALEKMKPRNVIAVIPAHNEEKTLAGTVRSLADQTRLVDRVIVVDDRSGDGTSRLAKQLWLEVFPSVANQKRKAGALNQLLACLLPTLDENDLVLAIDADTELDSKFVDEGFRFFDNDTLTGAISANHLIMRYRTLIETFQSMEFERDRRAIGRKHGRVGCMTGMASMFSVKALRAISAMRDGKVYDENCETEDWELTWAIKHAGYRCKRPQACLATTTPVDNWYKLFRQRERWGRGYVEALSKYKVTKFTISPWLGQVWWGFGLLMWLWWILLVADTTIATLSFSWPIWWIPIGLIFMLDKVVTVRRLGRKPMLIAALFVVELPYHIVIQLATINGVRKALLRSPSQWIRVR